MCAAGIQEWREAPVDAMVLSLQRLTEFYGLEIERGQAGLGNFNLRAGLLPVSLSSGFASRHTRAPESIVDTIRCGAVSPPSATASGHSAPTSASSAQSTEASSSSSTAMSLSSDATPCVTVEPQDTTLLTVHERAARVIASGNISLDSRLHVFTVAGTMEPRVVRLFPTTSCSCPASSQCYHVLAAKMAIGLQDNAEPTRRINLTQLRRNKRKKADKTSGRKRPRQNDVDVVAAGDADPEVAQQLAAAVTHGTTSATATATAAAVQDAVIDDDVCGRCHELAPPSDRASRRKRLITWIECELCKTWYHTICVGLGYYAPPSFVCDVCA